MMNAYEVDEAAPRGSVDFAETSVLNTIIPSASDLNIEEALSGFVERLGDGNESLGAAVPQRQALFFDETANIFVVLRTPYFDERALRSYLGRLVINVEAQVVNTLPENYDGSPASEVIYSGTVQDSEDPLIVVQGNEESDGAGHILVVWKLSTLLHRPHFRLQAPHVVFAATANLKAPEQINDQAITDEYLPSQIPSGINLLEAFGDDPAMGGIKPRLSALRVSQVKPMSQTAKEYIRPLRNISRQSIKIYPALNARLRYSRPNTSATYTAVIASLDIDITPYSNCKITLDKADLTIIGGTAENMNTVSGMKLPVECLPQDDVTFLYRLSPDEMDATNKSQIRKIDISISATANLSEDCEPKIYMHWTSTFDFTPPVNPGYGNPTQPIQRPHRPAQLSIGGSSIETVPTVASLAMRPDALPSIDVTTRQQRDSSIPDFGVTVTFTGPPSDMPIYPGVPFTWSVFIVNRCDRPRKLALMALPKRRRVEARVARPPSMGHAESKRDPKMANAVMDENINHAMQRNAAIEPTDIVSLSTDTRIGPLAPSACYEVELRFMALKVGIVDIEAVRVVDLGTQEHVDIKDLPSIMVSPLET